MKYSAFQKWLCRVFGIACHHRWVEVCAHTELLANDACPEKWPLKIKAWEPDPAPCPHKRVELCVVTRKRATLKCPGAQQTPLLPEEIPAECDHRLLTVCWASKQIPNDYCPDRRGKTVLPAEEAAIIAMGPCRIHVKPKPKDNPKPAWMPRMNVAVLSLHVQAHAYADEDLEAFAEKISVAGVDYVRLMSSWEEPAYQAMMKTTPAFGRIPGSPNLFNLEAPNPEYDRQLARVRDALEPYHVRIHFDLFDNCGEEWSPWRNNINGMGGVYDASALALGRILEWARRISAILPAAKGHRIGLGNELGYPGDAFGPDMEAWIRGIIKPLGEALLVDGYRPVPFSAAPNTGHWMHGVLSPDVSEVFGIRDAALQVHGQALAEEFDPAAGSDVRAYAYSDDGAHVKDPVRRGYCTPWPRCQASLEERVKTIKAWWGKYGDPRYAERRLDHIEFLPGEISGIEPPDRILPESLAVYATVADALGWPDILRSY